MGSIPTMVTFTVNSVILPEFAILAQSVEQVICNHQVVCSSHTGSSIIAVCFCGGIEDENLFTRVGNDPHLRDDNKERGRTLWVE